MVVNIKSTVQLAPLTLPLIIIIGNNRRVNPFQN